MLLLKLHERGIQRARLSLGDAVQCVLIDGTSALHFFRAGLKASESQKQLLVYNVLLQAVDSRLVHLMKYYKKSM